MLVVSFILVAIPNWTLKDWFKHKELPLDIRLVLESKTKTLAKRGHPPKSDLWALIRSGYGLDAADRNKVDVDNTPAFRHLLKWRGEVTRATQRSEPYLYHVYEQIETRGLPREIALLPFVESGYQVFARSPTAATGIWQLMPATAKHFGLNESWWIDERRDIISSTSAALDYLEYLYERFDNDWLLAIAAYNCGESNLRQAKRKSDMRSSLAKKGSIYWKIRKYLPRETRDYVPRLLAWAAIVEDPHRFNVVLAPIKNQPYFDEINANQQIDLLAVAKLTTTPLHELKRLNARLRHSVTAPSGPHRLLVPMVHSVVLSNQLATMHKEATEVD